MLTLRPPVVLRRLASHPPLPLACCLNSTPRHHFRLHRFLIFSGILVHGAVPELDGASCKMAWLSCVFWDASSKAFIYVFLGTSYPLLLCILFIHER